MNAALLKLIWLQPVLARKNMYPMKWLSLTLIAVAIGPALLSLVFTQAGDWQTPAVIALASTAICIASSVLFWFISFLPYCAAQYTPANAALLPDLRPNLRFSLLAAMAGLSATTSLAFLWMGWAYMALVYLLALFSACLYAAGMRDKRCFYLLSYIFILPLLPLNMLEKAELFGAFAWYAAIALSLPLLWYFSAWLFPLAGDKVFEIQANFKGYQRALEGKTSPVQMNLRRNLDPYYRRLAGLLAQGQKANKATLVGLVFGNESFALTMIINTVLFGLPFLLVLFLWNNGTQKSDFSPRLVLSLYILILQQSFYFLQIKMLSLRRYEQALLMLTPQFENQQTQKIWAKYLVSQYMQLWAMCLLVLALTTYFTQLDRRFAEWCFLALLAGLSFVPGLLRDFRKLDRFKNSVSLGYSLQVMLLTAGLCALRFYWSSPPFYLFVLLCLLPLIAYTYWKWQRFLRTPAFPVGYI